MISIISPVYNTGNCLEKLIEIIKKNLKNISSKYEILLVDDCSKDNSWSRIEKIAKKDYCVKGLKLKKNIGQHNAIYVGLKYSSGDIIIIMDSDLEDNPDYIKKLYKEFLKKNETIVATSHGTKGKEKRLISNIFWKFLSLVSLINFPQNMTNYTILPKKIAVQYLNSNTVGFVYAELKKMNLKINHLDMKRNQRHSGISSYNIIKCIKLGLIHIWNYNFINRLIFSRFIKKRKKFFKISSFINIKQKKKINL